MIKVPNLLIINLKKPSIMLLNFVKEKKKLIPRLRINKGQTKEMLSDASIVNSENQNKDKHCSTRTSSMVELALFLALQTPGTSAICMWRHSTHLVLRLWRIRLRFLWIDVWPLIMLLKLPQVKIRILSSRQKYLMKCSREAVLLQQPQKRDTDLLQEVGLHTSITARMVNPLNRNSKIRTLQESWCMPRKGSIGLLAI